MVKQKLAEQDVGMSVISKTPTPNVQNPHISITNIQNKIELQKTIKPIDPQRNTLG